MMHQKNKKSIVATRVNSLMTKKYFLGEFTQKESYEKEIRMEKLFYFQGQKVPIQPCFYNWF